MGMLAFWIIFIVFAYFIAKELDEDVIKKRKENMQREIDLKRDARSEMRKTEQRLHDLSSINEENNNV